MHSLINRIFHKKSFQEISENKSEVAHSQSADEELGSQRSNEVPAVTGSIHLDVPQFIIGVGQSKGILRDKNEDALITLTTNLITNNTGLQLGLYMIADGMGGHENGEIASGIAVKIMLDQVISKFYKPLFSQAGQAAELSIQEIIKLGIQEAHKEIKKETLGGGSTLTAALLLGRQLTIGHVGDSRAYLFSPIGDLKLLTKDHSLVKRLEEMGEISLEQASTHPQRNYLYRAVGQGDFLEPDIATYYLDPGTQLILCSDGLWGVLSEKELIKILETTAAPQQVCQQLVDMANSAGGPDNISVIIVRLPEES